MKKLLLVLVTMVLLASIGWAGEKEELQWKGRAIVSEYQLRQQQFNEASAALAEFAKELDAKGYIFQGNQIVEKPKPKAEEPKKEPKK